MRVSGEGASKSNSGEMPDSRGRLFKGRRLVKGYYSEVKILTDDTRRAYRDLFRVNYSGLLIMELVVTLSSVEFGQGSVRREWRKTLCIDEGLVNSQGL